VDPSPPSSTSAPERPTPTGGEVSPSPATAMEQANGFAAATLSELRKVVWPSRQQLFNETVAVIVMVAVSAASIAALDRFYSWGAKLLFR
jgi:preprotein translocase subunit SecE